MKITIQWIQYPMPSLVAQTKSMSLAFSEIEVPVSVEGIDPAEAEKIKQKRFEEFTRDASIHGLLLSPGDWISPSEIKRIWRSKTD